MKLVKFLKLIFNNIIFQIHTNIKIPNSAKKYWGVFYIKKKLLKYFSKI